MNFAFLHKYASLMHFYRLSRTLTPWLAGITLILFGWGLVGGLLLAPSCTASGARPKHPFGLK